MSFLVTGSTGNVGREVIKDLMRTGDHVRAAVYEEGITEVEGAPAVRFDFRAPSTFAPALEGISKVFLMRPPDIADVDATLIPFFEAAKKAQVRQIVFLSLIGVDKNKKIPHYAVEQAIIPSGIPYTFVRPGFFMQNSIQAYRDDIRFDDRIYVVAGKGKLGFIDVADIGAVAAKALREEGHENKAYSITGPESITHFEVAAMISNAVGRKITYANPSNSDYKAHLFRMGYSADYVEVMGGIYFPVRMGWAGGLTDEFEQLMGRKPRNFADFARDNAALWAPPTQAERDARAAKLATIPPPPTESLWSKVKGFFNPSRIGA
jgi:uncharacterized protein YbjT (DUF2867 family)